MRSFYILVQILLQSIILHTTSIDSLYQTIDKSNYINEQNKAFEQYFLQDADSGSFQYSWYQEWCNSINRCSINDYNLAMVLNVAVDSSGLFHLLPRDTDNVFYIYIKKYKYCLESFDVYLSPNRVNRSYRYGITSKRKQRALKRISKKKIDRVFIVEELPFLMYQQYDHYYLYDYSFPYKKYKWDEVISDPQILSRIKHVGDIHPINEPYCKWPAWVGFNSQYAH